jgi:hypothetical protein
MMVSSARTEKAKLQPLMTIFEDNFETYEVGSFPSEGGWTLEWVGAGTSDQEVVDSVSLSPANSLKLLGWGVDGGAHRAAIAAKSVGFAGSTLAYEVYVRVNQTCSFDSSAVVGFGKSTAVGIKRSNEVRFCYDGLITTWVAGGEKCGTTLQSYVPDTWYKIYVELNTISNTFDIWINDELRGSDFNARIPAEEIEFFSLTSNYGNTEAFFDEVVTSCDAVGGTNILVDPEQTALVVGATFTTKIHILNVEDLYGLDIRLQWNASLLNYVNHTVTIPVESYPDGILHEPVAIFKNEVNHTLGSCWIAYTSLTPASAFDGSGVVVEIAFQTITYGSGELTISASELADYDGNPIPHSVTHAYIVVHDFHDVAITDLAVGKTIIGEGYCTSISVLVANRGAFPEDFTVILRANGTTISETSVTLASGDSAVIRFMWNTTGWGKGFYLIDASIPLVPDEANAVDNSYIDGYVFLTLAGDVNGDRDVDIFDAVKIARAYGSYLGDVNYDPICDLNGDGAVDIFDIVIAAMKFGQSW